MTAEWTTSRFDELSINFDGKRRPVKKSDRRPGPYPYYGASGVVDHVDDYIFDGDYLLVAEDGENLRTRRTPIAFLARGRFWVNNHAHIVTGNKKADTRFLMYALQHLEIDAYLTGAVMPKLTQGNLNRIEVSHPLLPEQRAIVGVLGALDDKIEQNLRTARVLDWLARTIFRAWFVDFEPVKAKAAGADSFPSMPQHVFDDLPTQFVGSEIGPVPREWEVKTISESILLTMGQSPPSEFYNEIGEGLPFHQGVTDYGFRFPTHKETANRLNLLPRNHPDPAKASESVEKTIRGMIQTIQGLCELRNNYGMASHGRDAFSARLELRQATLAAQAADTIVSFLYRIHRDTRTQAPGGRVHYEDRPDFNEAFDRDNESIRLSQLGLLPSHVLFQCDHEAYKAALSDYITERNEGGDGAGLVAQDGQQQEEVE